MTVNKRLKRLLRQYESGKITKEGLRRLLEKGVLGRVTGIIGPFVLRYRGKKLIISERAVDYNKSMTAESVAGRNNFAAKVKFAQFVYNMEGFKEIWGRAELEGTLPWNRIIKYNRVSGFHPDSDNTITPPVYHFTSAVTCTLSKAFSVVINGKTQGRTALRIVLAAYDPINSTDPAFEIIEIRAGELNALEINICWKYRKYILYSAEIRKEGSSVEWSNTVVSEGSIPAQEVFSDEERVLQWVLLAQGFIGENDRVQEVNYPLRL